MPALHPFTSVPVSLFTLRPYLLLILADFSGDSDESVTFLLVAVWFDDYAFNSNTHFSVQVRRPRRCLNPKIPDSLISQGKLSFVSSSCVAVSRPRSMITAITYGLTDPYPPGSNISVNSFFFSIRMWWWFTWIVNSLHPIYWSWGFWPM